MENGYRIVSEELLRENRFDYEIIVAEPGAAVAYTAEELYFGPLLLQQRSEAFLVKWRRMLRQKQQTLANFERARDAVPVAKTDEFARQIAWINQVLG
ncbi:tRNA (adenine(22)-N(1))-methyltransferase [compost metagenome]